MITTSEQETLLANKAAFADLLNDCIASYIQTETGESHRAHYVLARAQIEDYWPDLQAAHRQGADITDPLLDKLIAHPRFKHVSQAGIWTHPAASSASNLKNYYQGAGLVQEGDWPNIASAVFFFLQRSVNDPAQLSQAIEEFIDSGYQKGFASGMLSPTLNALRPNDFIIINKKSLDAIKLFSGVKYKSDLDAYPKANSGGRRLVDTYHDILAKAQELELFPSELFDAFSHWLSLNKQKAHERVNGSIDVIGPDPDDNDDAEDGDEEATDADEQSTLEVQHPYSIAEMASETMMPIETLRQWRRAIGRKGQIIFYGPPGTGKTHLARKLARHLVGGDNGFWELMQFHPAYAYEDFIEGIRPRALSAGTHNAARNGSTPTPQSSQNSTGGFTYDMIPGRFLQFCAEAGKRNGLCVLIIDEINRAELSRVFGELMYLLEYRSLNDDGNHDFAEIPLAGGSKFQIPHNVRIIGTMNTADRSIALVDHALRRRFAFIPVYPDYELLIRYHAQHNPTFPAQALVTWLKTINKELDSHYALGVSFFLQPNLAENIEDIWRMEIEPYLEEYFFDRREKAKEFAWEKGELKNRLSGQSATQGNAAGNADNAGDATSASDNSPLMPSTIELSNSDAVSDLGGNEDEAVDGLDDDDSDEDESANVNSPAFAS